MEAYEKSRTLIKMVVNCVLVLEDFEEDPSDTYHALSTFAQLTKKRGGILGLLAGSDIAILFTSKQTDTCGMAYQVKFFLA